MGRMKAVFGDELMFPSDYLSAIEFKGKDVTLTITNITREELHTNANETKLCWVFAFKETKKRFILSAKANEQSLARLYGTQAKEWIGKQITLYPTKCKAFGETVDCIRIREK